MVASFFSATSLAVLFHSLTLVHCFNGAHLSHRWPPYTLRNAPTSATRPLATMDSAASYSPSSLSPHIPPFSRAGLTSLAASNENDSETSGADSTDGDEEESIDVNADPRLRRIRLSRALGIDWGTDLSFSFVYVRDLEPSGAAAISGEVEVGDQICEMRAVSEDGKAINLIGAPFDGVMGAFAALGRDVREVDLVFFRGTKEELKGVCAGGTGSEEEEKITITVVQNKGAKDEAIRRIEAKTGCNVRQILTDNGINVYQSLTRWTNCKGKQLCGTCIVNITDGGGGTNRKSLDEASTLRENPESYRLSCVTFAYGDITVETFPPIEAAQWTR
mmetsp:Transcript_14852/g.26573  ORF Transcript_14852/g.26573 Transcript_14852/m.26573 type:complete len:333 (-) Transcript_14852:8-1006(-)